MPKDDVGTQPKDDGDVRLRAILSGIEPELRRLNAVISNLTVLAASQDNIEPTALTVLAEVGSDAIGRATSSWRDAFNLAHAAQRRLVT
ncbi:hypothetical protein IG197_16855 [Aminobacter sp. SR38]|uniref:hypothetical protein n=1 Tax=Aminobacter sp. SR38 TaxID=2774562 RepID=UPI0017805FB1|nr:hypothetical protein [Aminobacter sp. SR38]QOF69530.1 hypothetical protein IG197_16855 [Aminobacter sp. SR38]